MIEFMPWYEAGRTVVRCAGDDGCGAHLSEGDIELHQKFHAKIEAALLAKPSWRRPPSAASVLGLGGE